MNQAWAGLVTAWRRLWRLPAGHPGTGGAAGAGQVRSPADLASVYQLLETHTRDIMLFVRQDGQIIEANAAAARAYGYERSELLGLTIHDLRAEETLGQVPAQMAQAGAGGVLFETLHRRRDGATFPVEVSWTGADLGEQRVLLHVIRDVTQRKRREAAQELLHEIDNAILHHQPPDQILRLVTGRLAHLFRCAAVWVGLKEPDGRVTIHAAAGAAAALAEGVSVRWDDSPSGQGPTGIAIRTAATQAGSMAGNADLAPRRDLTEGWSLQSYLTIPLVVGDQVLGVLSLFSTQPDAFADEDTLILTGFAQQVTISLMAAHTQAQVRLLTVALESAANALVITDTSGIIRWVNPAFTRLTGYSAEEAAGQSIRLPKSDSHTADFYRNLWETILSGQVWRGEIHNRRKDGSLYVEDMTIAPVRDTDGEIRHFVAVKQDVTERKRRDEQIRQLMTYDALTGVANRRTLSERLGWAIARARRGHPGYLMIINLDNFRQHNETFGRAGADQLLVMVARALDSTLREEDLFSRLGGDEFAVLLYDSKTEQAGAAAERLRSTVERLDFRVGGQLCRVGVSIGATPVDGTQHVDAVLSAAYTALYSAKGMGRNRVVVAQYTRDRRQKERQ